MTLQSVTHIKNQIQVRKQIKMRELLSKERRVSGLKSGEMEKPGNCFFWQKTFSRDAPPQKRDVPKKQHLISHQDNMTDLSTFNLGLFSPLDSHEFSRTQKMFEA